MYRPVWSVLSSLFPYIQPTWQIMRMHMRYSYEVSSTSYIYRNWWQIPHIQSYCPLFFSLRHINDPSVVIIAHRLPLTLHCTIAIPTRWCRRHNWCRQIAVSSKADDDVIYDSCSFVLTTPRVYRPVWKTMCDICDRRLHTGSHQPPCHYHHAR